MVLQGRVPQGVAAKPPPRTCYCETCTPVRDQLEALRDRLREIQDADGHSHIPSPRPRRDRSGRRTRWPRTPEQLEARRARERQYKEQHREEIRERDRRYREANRDELRERRKNWARNTDPAATREQQRRYRESHRDKIQRYQRRLKRLNAESRDQATRHGQQWTGPEMEIAARDDLPVAELARMLGRTIASVTTMRAALRTEPKYQQVAGLSERAAS